ncbi:MAG: GNAT family N-acetyltransferase, partial [Pseudomonadales bacterium]|nr:GNAT family N-acetyltransferase [Pseudomonadales bacterium]
MQYLLADYQNNEHARAIAYLMDCYAKDPMGGSLPLDKSIRDNIANGLKRYANAFSLLAFKGGKPAGLINAFENFCTFECRPLIHIHDLIVSPDYRGLGIAKKLLNEIEHLAHERDCCKITLEVLKSKASSHTLYNQQGFAAYQL